MPVSIKHAKEVATIGSSDWIGTANHLATLQAVEGVSLGGNTAGLLALISSGTLILAGGNNVTLSQDGQSVTVSGAALTAPIAGAAIASVGTATASGTATSRFAAEDHVHAGVPVAGISGGNTAGETGSRYGSVLLAGGNNVTLSGATAAGGQTITISAGAGGAAGSNTLGMSNLGNTSGTSGVVSGSAVRYVFAGGNNITLSQSLDAGNVSGTITISAANETQTVPPIGTAVKPVQSSGSTGTITRFAPEDHAHQGVAGWDVNGIASTFFGTQQLSAGNLMSIATGGNTSRGSAQIIGLLSSATTVSSVTTGNVVGAMASRFALEGHQHAGVGRIGVSTLGNTAGSTTLLHARSVYLAGGNNITLSQSTDANHDVTVTISAGAGGAGNTISGFLHPPGIPLGNINIQVGNGSLFLSPMILEQDLAFDRVLIPIHVSISSSSNSSHGGTLSMAVGIYTRNASTLSQLASASRTQAWTNTSNNSLASLTDIRHFSIGFTTTLTLGASYWVGVWSRTSTVNANWASISQRGFSAGTTATQAFRGYFAAASATSDQPMLGFGSHSATSAALHASAAFSDIQGTAVGINRFPVIVQFASSTI
ncbi:MAG: hypothetical protein ACRDHG_13735 [Anaerolineales bacterium]